MASKRKRLWQELIALGGVTWVKLSPQLSFLWKLTVTFTQRFWDFMSDRFLKGFASLLCLGTLIFVSWSLLEGRVYLIEPLQVPQSLSETGYNGHTLAARIIDRLQLIRSGAKTNLPRRDVAEQPYLPVTPAEEIHIKVGDISLRATINNLKLLLGRAYRITGEVVAHGTEWNISIRVHDSTGSFTSTNISTLVHNSAMFILRKIEPSTVGLYQYRTNDNSIVDTLRHIIRDDHTTRLEKAHAYNLWGLHLKRQKQYDKAISMLKLSIETAPGVGAYVNWANVLLFDLKKPQAAIDILKTAHSYQRHPAILSTWGTALNRQKRFSEAEKKFKETIEVDSRWLISGTISLGQALSARGKSDDAIALYTPLVDLYPELQLPLATVYNNRGHELNLKRQYREGITMFERSIQLSPTPNAYNNWAYSLSQLGDYKSAIEKLGKAIQIDDDNADAHKMLGEVYKLLGQGDKAKRYFDRHRELTINR